MIGRGEAGPEITDNKLPVFWEVGMGVAEVAVDPETGEVKLKKFISVADVGKAIHPEALRRPGRGRGHAGDWPHAFRATHL